MKFTDAQILDAMITLEFAAKSATICYYTGATGRGIHHDKELDEQFIKAAAALGYRMVPIVQPDPPASDPDTQTTRLWRMGYRAGLYAATEQQPTTAIDPNENAYQKGRFDGVMEFGKAIATLQRAVATPASDLTGDVTIRGEA